MDTIAEQEQAAIKIQSAFRGMQARDKVKDMKAQVTKYNSVKMATSKMTCMDCNGKVPVITEVSADTVGGVVSVYIPPRELTPGDRLSLLLQEVPLNRIQVSTL